jgi:hypothetical protein
MARRSTRQSVAHGEGEVGRWWGLPPLPDGDIWLDCEQVGVLTCRPTHTISSWLYRGGPARAPFPQPALTINYRLYWRRTIIAAWMVAYYGPSAAVLGRIEAWPLGGDTEPLGCPALLL